MIKQARVGASIHTSVKETYLWDWPLKQERIGKGIERSPRQPRSQPCKEYVAQRQRPMPTKTE
jgi:hypothetical protein